MPGPIYKDNGNKVTFLHFSGNKINQLVTLDTPASLFASVMCGGGGGATMLVAAWFSFTPLKISAPVPLGQLPVNLEAFPISHFQRAVLTGLTQWPTSVGQVVPPHPVLKFRCPFSEFYLNMWGIDGNGNVALTDVTLTIIASNDIEEIQTYPTPKIFNVP